MYIRNLLAAIGCLVFGSCHGQVESKAYAAMLQTLLSHSVPEISVDEAVKTGKDAVWLDAREPREYAVSHLKDAINVGYDRLDLSKVRDLPRDTPIVVYCSVGYRSEKVAEQLIAKGFTNVKNLYGGIFEWANRSKPVYSGKSLTQKVHAFDRTWGVWLKKGEKVY